MKGLRHLITFKRFMLAVPAAALAAALGLTAGGVLSAPGMASADQSDGTDVIGTITTQEQIYSGPGSAFTTTGMATSGSSYTVLCYSGSARSLWGLIASPDNPTQGIGYVPAPSLKTVADITTLVPTCPSTGLVVPQPAVGQKDKTKTKKKPRIPFPPIPPTTGNDDDQGPGEACVFIRVNGADGRGHLGWGFKATNGRPLYAGADKYVFGATEGAPSDPSDPNSPGKLWVPGGTPHSNGSWHDEQSKAMMLATFADPSSNPNVTSNVARNVAPYDKYRCEPTRTSNVTAARVEIAKVESQGYCITRAIGIGPGNCLDQAIQILRAYGADMPSAFIRFKPNDWFEQLPPPWEPSTPL